jgi:hypothetical protein
LNPHNLTKRNIGFICLVLGICAAIGNHGGLALGFMIAYILLAFGR